MNNTTKELKTPSREGLKYLSKKNFVGVFANWAIQQSPYTCPDNLERVIIKADGYWPTGDVPHHIKGWAYEELNDFVHDFVFSTPEVVSWNNPRSGQRVDHMFVSMFSQAPLSDDDFVDLDALVRNIVNTLWALD